MKRLVTVAVFVAILLAQASLGSAAGFLIYEHGAAAMAMAGAFVSIANDPSAIWHNPAGIAFLKGTHVSVGTTLIQSSGKMTLTEWPFPQPQKSWEQDKQVFYPSTVYFTQSVGEKVTLGFGFFSPYGLGASWPKENQLRYLGYKDDMKTFFFNPTIGVKLTDQLSIGAGFSYIYSTVLFKLVERIDLKPYHPLLGAYDVPASLEGNGSSFNVNAGLLFRSEKYSFGLNYRSAFDINFKGDLSLTTSELPPPFNSPSVFPDAAKGETNFKCPHIFGLGASVNVSEKFLLTADINYVLWSRFDKYVVKFDNPLFEPLETLENWDDAFTFRLGGQYMISPQFSLRAGLIFDVTPQPKESMDPLLPDANRYAGTVGFGWKLAKNLVLDLAFQHEIFEDRTSPNRDIYPFNFGQSDYSTTANLLGISLSFVF